MSGENDELISLLRRILPSSPGVVLVHSSLAKLMPPESVDKKNVLAAMAGLVDNGWTLAFPAFTFSFCHGKPFDLRSSASETGVLADWVLEMLPGAVRTRHPVYSFVVVGPRTKEIAACSARTSFGDDTPFAFFEQENAWQIALGNGVRDFTQCHRYEELANVPYRYWKEFSGQSDFGDGAQIVTRRLFVLDLRLDAQRDWNIIFDKARSEGVLHEYPLWRGKVHIIKTDAIKRIVTAILTDDAFGLLQNAADVRKRLRESGDAPVLKVALLGHSNMQLLYNAMEKELIAADPRLVFRLYTAPYNQVERELSLTDSALARFNPDVSIFCNRLEDLFDSFTLACVDRDTVAARVRDYAEAIAAWGRDNDGWLFVFRFSPLDSMGRLIGCEVFEELNGILSGALAKCAKIVWVGPGVLAAEIDGRAIDDRLLLMGRFPFSQAMSHRLAMHWSGLLLAVSGRSVRALVLDLDDTLWGGTLGEDGVHGLQVGQDYPGNAFRVFQLALKQAASTGLLLCVASKNDSALALNAMDMLPGMAIRSADLAAHRIGWEPKWKGIKEMAAELNLGLASFLFIDNSPVERDEVRAHLPDVKILDLPEDCSEWVRTLLSSPWLAQLPLTKEDELRGASYQAKIAVDKERENALTAEQFYAGLNLRMKVFPLSDSNLVRAEQLCQKTNQFNASGKRHRSRDLLALASSAADVFVLNVSDKYAEHGDVGLIISKAADDDPQTMRIETYLLSCRVLGRGIESGALCWAMRRAKENGMTKMEVEFHETERNAPVVSALSSVGMRHVSLGRWSISLENPPEVPAWLTVEVHNTRAELPSPDALRSDEPRIATESDNNRSVANTVGRTVLSVLQSLFEPEKITEDSALGTTPGWDSMKHFSVVLAVEKEIGIQFTVEEMAETTSCKSLMLLCDKKLREQKTSHSQR